MKMMSKSFLVFTAFAFASPASANNYLSNSYNYSSNSYNHSSHSSSYTSQPLNQRYGTHKIIKGGSETASFYYRVGVKQYEKNNLDESFSEVN